MAAESTPDAMVTVVGRGPSVTVASSDVSSSETRDVGYFFNWASTRLLNLFRNCGAGGMGWAAVAAHPARGWVQLQQWKD